MDGNDTPKWQETPHLGGQCNKIYLLHGERTLIMDPFTTYACHVWKRPLRIEAYVVAIATNQCFIS